MRVAVFNSKPYDVEVLGRANRRAGHDLRFHECTLDSVTARLATDADVVCAVVDDDLSTATIERLALAGIGLIALRCRGINNVDLEAARRHDISIVRAARYSPHAVAEHAVGLMLSLDRRIHRAHQRVRDNNFSLDGLLGFELFGKTVGVLGTGAIGTRFTQICAGIGMRVLATDPHPNPLCAEAGVLYVSQEELLAQSDIVSLHCPLTASTHHLIDERRLSTMKDGVMVINTSRGALLDMRATIDGLKSGKIGHLGIDIYEEDDGLQLDEVCNATSDNTLFPRLSTFPNVLITGHQGFFTREALDAIAHATIESVSAYAAGERLEHEVLLADRS